MVNISSWHNCLINWRSFIKVRSNLCKRFTKKFYHFRLGKVYIIWPCRSKPERLSTYNVIWTGCHVFFNHLLHEPLQPKRKDRMATIVFKRHVWLLHLYRYINPCLALFNISDGHSAKVVYSCSELLCNISTPHKLPKAKLVPGRVTHDMPNHGSTGVSVYFSCRVMTKIVALNQWNHQKHTTFLKP